jgi:hypothetical protein
MVFSVACPTFERMGAIDVSTREVIMNGKWLAAAMLLWMFSLTAQADCAVLGPGEDPCAGPVLGPTTCVCEP